MIDEFIAKIDEQLTQVYSELLNASSSTEGDIKNRRDRLERLKQEYKNNLDDSKKEHHPLMICVITGTAHRLRSNLEERYYQLVYPGSHDEEILAHWRPFADSEGYIDDILKEFKEQYAFQFQKCYYGGKVDARTRATLSEEIENTVALIDLLTLDEENWELAQLFNQAKVGKVMIPICQRINSILRDYMVQKREQKFDVLRVVYIKKPDLYRPALNEKDDLLHGLIEFFSVKDKAKPNFLTDRNSEQDFLKRLSNPSFE